jgi:hypothetical protein
LCAIPSAHSLDQKLTINETPIITVIGKAFWEIGHAPQDQSNRRKRLPLYSVWEIHPVMALQINQSLRQRLGFSLDTLAGFFQTRCR